jgi:predicted dienelactone hydrolase
MTRLGLLGHSLGGYTALGLSGAWASWRVNGVKAVLALSPYSQPFVRHHTLGGVAAPVMYQSGTHDFGIAPSIRRPAGSYDQSPAPKYFVEFDQAGHGAWTDFSHTAHDAIIAYSLAFMNHYVKGDAADPLLTHGTPGVTLYRYVSDLGSSGATVGDESVPTPARPGVRERWRRWRHGDK